MTDNRSVECTFKFKTMLYYSIVIPHKNAQDLLKYCLDSIPIRDDIQVIVVDDNSDADKVDFVNFPRWGGKCFECIFNKEGLGAGHARNEGIKHAKGKWLLFVDADDYLLPTANRVFDEEKYTEADIVFFRPKAMMLSDRATPSPRANRYTSIVDDYLRSGDETDLRSKWYVPWSKLMRREFIESRALYFDEIVYSEDMVFSIKAGILAQRVIVRDHSYYCATFSDNSMTSRFRKGEFQSIYANTIFRSNELLYENNYPLDLIVSFNCLRRLFSSSKESFFLIFKQMQKMGYKKAWLLKEIFKGNSTKSRIKRSVYVFLFCR